MDVNANTMVQIAINKVLETEAPKFNRKKFERAVEYAMTQTGNYAGFLEIIRERFMDAGVVLVLLPNMGNSGISGATKRVDGKVMLMVNDRKNYLDSFWFTLFHEIGHIINGDFGITFDNNKNAVECNADIYAQNKLIPPLMYEEFLNTQDKIDEMAIIRFSESIGRDPGIVVGRLLNDKIITIANKNLLSKFRKEYRVMID